MKKADAICTAYRSATKNTRQPRTYDQVVAFVKRTLPLYEAALLQLEALTPPSKDAAAVRAWLAADRGVAKATRDLGNAAERRDYPSINAALARSELAASRGRRAAAALGMQVCARLATGR